MSKVRGPIIRLTLPLARSRRPGLLAGVPVDDELHVDKLTWLVENRSNQPLKGGDAVNTLADVLVVGYEPPEGSPGWPVLAEVPPYLTVLRGRPEDLPAIARYARLAIGRRPDGSPERVGDETVLDELDDAARLFLRAWLESPIEKSERPGEGLPWDAPGFEPPGPPTSGRDKTP